jgi:hypothetical protein
MTCTTFKKPLFEQHNNNKRKKNRNQDDAIILNKKIDQKIATK